MIIIQLDNIDIHMVGSSLISASNDCCVYLVSSRDFSILIDTGTGSKHSINTICSNIEAIEPLTQIHYILVTHAHIDHVGGLRDMKSRLPQAKIIAHNYAADIIANEDPVLSAAKWYRTTLHAVDIDIKLTEPYTIKAAEVEFIIIPTPGHTPGSVVGLLTIPRIEKRVLFGQDIHGPFMPQFRSDVGQWRQSMQKLLELKPDYLCEGHFGIIEGKENVRQFIEGYLNSFS